MPEFPIAHRGRPLGGPFRQWVHFRLVPFVVAMVAHLLRLSLRRRYEGDAPVRAMAAEDARFVLAFWHRRLVMMPLAYPFRRRNAAGERRGVAILSSDSKDGERSAATWRWFGIHAVRGTASHGGAQAKAGVLAVSRKTGAWLVPVCVSYSRAWTLKTWDAMLVPKPFSTVTVRYGEPFRLAEREDEEAARLRLEQALNGLEQLDGK